MKTVSENAAFGGVQGVYSHASDVCGCEMTFAVYLPPQAKAGQVPVLWYLSGLTCTHENAMTKAGAQGWAAEEGIAVIFPDTSPRGEGVADDAAYDLGQGAGFYVNATEAPWAPHFRMWDYVVDELPELVFAELPLDRGAAGDHRALDGRPRGADHRDDQARHLPLALGDLADRQPDASDWGRKQFAAYLGGDEAAWARARRDAADAREGLSRADPRRPGGEGPVPRPPEARGAGRGGGGAAPADAVPHDRGLRPQLLLRRQRDGGSRPLARGHLFGADDAAGRGACRRRAGKQPEEDDVRADEARQVRAASPRRSRPSRSPRRRRRATRPRARRSSGSAPPATR